MSKEQFDKNNYVLIKEAISKELADFLFKYLQIKAKAVSFMREKTFISPFDKKWGTFGDNQTNGQDIYCSYGDAAMDTLLMLVKPKIESILETKVVEHYSYTRLYEKGSELKPHKDREACGTSTTLNLGGDPWPIFMKPQEESEPISFTLMPGDLLLYNGTECIHWREKFEGSICGQVFLHYTIYDKNSKLQKYDGRPMLGLQIKKHQL